MITENCANCGVHVLGYEIILSFERTENFTEFQLNIPFIRFENEDTINLNLVTSEKGTL
ncbi:hypothetical protein D3C80_2231710 [compost metagenome]